VLIWSSGYVVGSIAAKSAAPVAITTWRLGLAAVLLAALARGAGRRWPGRATLGAVAGTGVVLFGVQFGALYLAMSEACPRVPPR